MELPPSRGTVTILMRNVRARVRVSLEVLANVVMYCLTDPKRRPYRREVSTYEVWVQYSKQGMASSSDSATDSSIATLGRQGSMRVMGTISLAWTNGPVGAVGVRTRVGSRCTASDYATLAVSCVALAILDT